MKKIFSGLLQKPRLIFGSEHVGIKDRYCKFKGISVYTEAYNCDNKEDECIVFLHGLGGNHSDGSFLYGKDNKYMTVTVDMLNHGRSGKIENLTWEEYIDAVKAVIDTYGMKRVHFVGHSLGADTAMMYAKKYPEDVAHIILLDRAYYNYSDVARFNFTSSFYKAAEYNPGSGLEYHLFCNLVDMSLENDITKTWDLNIDVLLVAADPYWPTAKNGGSGISEYIAAVKKSPDDFGIPLGQASSLPDISPDNLNDYMEFLRGRILEFAKVNKHFYVVQPPFEHAMVFNEAAKSEIMGFVLEFIKNNDKSVAVYNIEKKIKENKFESKSFKDILNDCKEAKDTGNNI